MRYYHSLIPLFPLLLALVPATLAATSEKASEKTSKSSSSSESGVVEFLQTMQAAQIASLPCLITLVNMTETPIGKCLGINDLATLLVSSGSSSANKSAGFSSGLDDYLTSVCKGTECTDMQISEARAQLDSTCQGQTGGGLVPAIQAILTNYKSSYKTLGCNIYFNGTADNCVIDTISTSQSANNPNFFMDLVSGNNLQQYADNVFKSAKCTGCMHELYKAAVFLLPNIRSQSITSDMGNHLKNDCGGGDNPNWPTVMDQSMPEALTVEQNTKPGGTKSSSAIGVRAKAGQEEVVRALMVVLAGLGVAGM